MEEKNIRDPRPEQEADISSKLNNNKQTDDSPEKESERGSEKELGEKSESGSENRSGAEPRVDYFDEPGQSADYPEDYEAGVSNAGVSDDSSDSGYSGKGSPSADTSYSGKGSFSADSGKDNSSGSFVKESPSADSGREGGPTGSHKQSGSDKESGSDKQNGSADPEKTMIPPVPESREAVPKNHPKRTKAQGSRKPENPGKKGKPGRKEKPGRRKRRKTKTAAA